jgi:hypothetical protein
MGEKKDSPRIATNRWYHTHHVFYRNFYSTDGAESSSMRHVRSTMTCGKYCVLSQVSALRESYGLSSEQLNKCLAIQAAGLAASIKQTNSPTLIKVYD